MELCADICRRWELDPQHGGLIRHYDVTGKICPKWFVDHPDAWEQFKDDVASAMRSKSGWQQEDAGWRFYLDNDHCVVNDWYEDEGRWYWFDGAGMMVKNVWYQYHGNWYYLGADGAMVKGQQTIDGRWYIMDDEGRMLTEPVTLTPGWQMGRCGGRGWQNKGSYFAALNRFWFHAILASRCARLRIGRPCSRFQLFWIAISGHRYTRFISLTSL